LVQWPRSGKRADCCEPLALHNRSQKERCSLLWREQRSAGLLTLVPVHRAVQPVYELDMPLTDIDHRGRSGCQRILLPIAVTRADLKPIVEEQSFHLLGIDIAQGSAMRLLHELTSWMVPLVGAGVVLDLGHGIVVLLLSDHELP